MRKFIITAAVAITTLTAFAAPSQAGGIYFGFGDGYGRGNVQVYDTGYYGHRHHRSHCWTKKIRKYDAYGNRYYKRIRVCN